MPLPPFDELKSYVGFGPEDARALADLKPLAEPHFARIVDEFYAHIQLHAGARSVLRDAAQMDRLRGSLHLWLADLLAGPHDDAYLARRSRIGVVHVKVGLAQHYMVTAMSRIRGALENIASDSFADAHAARRAREAVGRVCDLDLAVMLETYRDDYIGRLQRMERMERASVEHRLADLERFHRDATEASNIIIIGLDATTEVVLFNATACSTTGWARDEVVGREPFALLFGEMAAEARSLLLRRDGMPATSIELALMTRAGHERLVRWHSSRHAQGATEYPTWLLSGVDVTEERNLERRARLNERLAVAGTLAAGLAHEIRNPLNGAGLHLSVLERAIARNPAVGPSAAEAASVLRTEIKRLSSLVTDFLEVARPKPLQRGACDLNDVVAGVATLVRPEAEAKRIRVEVTPFAFPVKMSVDGERLRQALLNLVQNAMESIGHDGRVALRVRRSPRDAEVEIEDDGPGLPDSRAPIFDAFYTTKDRGTGLGLSIVHRIVTDHGGDIAVSSAPGRTSFSVRLPLDIG